MKTVNSPFKSSGLLAYLNYEKETQLIVCGLQTEYCMDATVTCGFEHGFEIFVPAYANTTLSNAFMSGEDSYHYYNDTIWKNRYANCLSMEEMIQMMQRDGKSMIGNEINVVIDRKLGSKHPKHELVYPVNYGYVEGVMGGDGEEQDVYVIGVNTPLDTFHGEIIAIVKRQDDVEEKWVVAPVGRKFSLAEIERTLYF